MENVRLSGESLCQSFARQLGAPVSRVLKSIVFEWDVPSQPSYELRYAMVVMCGDRKVDARTVSRLVGCKKAATTSEERASTVTGYVFGGTSPFGILREADVRLFVDAAVADGSSGVDHVWLSGGSRMLALRMKTVDFLGVLLGRNVEITHLSKP